MPQDRFSLLLYRTCLLGCFLGLAATLYFLGGVSGHIGSPLLNMATAAVPILAALFFLYIFFLLMPDKNRLGSLIWLLILLVFSAEVVLGLVPPTARDELTHHLAIPKLYVNSGKIFEIPFAPYSYYPMLLDMLYTPFVKWGWDSIPKLIHGLYGFLTGVLLYAYLARRLSPLYGLLGFFFFIFTPAILRLGNWAYVDLGLIFYSTASLLCLLRWNEAMETKRWLVLAGLSAGFALATKPNGFLVFLLLFLFLVLLLGRERGGGLWEMASLVFLFLILAFIPFSPWSLKNLIQTGNPFFPLLSGFFGGGGGGGISVSGGVGLGILAKREFLYGESWWQIAALPLRIFFSGQDDNPQYFDGVLNPMLIVFLPWAFKGKWVQEKKLLFTFALFYLLYAFFLVDMRIRYVLPIVPPLIILSVYGVHNIYLRIVHPSILFVVIILLMVPNGVYLWDYFRKVSPTDYLRGREGREAYLSRMLLEYPAIQYINRNLPATARIYFLFMGRRVYYCKRGYFHDTGDNAWVLLRMIQSAQDKSDIKGKLQRRGLTHLLVREELLKRFLSNNLSLRQQRIWDSFATFHLQGLFRARGYSLYRVHG